MSLNDYIKVGFYILCLESQECPYKTDPKGCSHKAKWKINAGKEICICNNKIMRVEGLKGFLEGGDK